MQPRPRIIFMGRGQGYEEVAKEFGCELDQRLDMNFVMMPLAGSMMSQAMSSTAEVSVLINSDIILTQTLPDAIAKIRTKFSDWFLSGARSV
jgi:hypothetical protein